MRNRRPFDSSNWPVAGRRGRRRCARGVDLRRIAGQHAGRPYAQALLVSGERFQYHLGGLPKHKLRRVTEFIEENLDHDLTLAEIAEIAELSPFHFARAFKQATGSTPIQFLTRRRIDLAK